MSNKAQDKQAEYEAYIEAKYGKIPTITEYFAITENKQLEHSMSDAILEQIKGASYEEGMRDALTYLAELYDGVEDTDLWADYMKEEAK
jgi:hypothetical protein